MSPQATKKRGLGRGLDALLQAEPARALPIDALEPNRLQPRSAFDDARLTELADSIRAQGVVQPLVVTRNAGGGYTIVAGERRWRAARKAGLTEVPVVIREVAGDRELLELALVENLQREDLNPIEEAEAYRTLATTFELVQEEIATRVGKSRPAVTNALRLLNLPPEIQEELRSGRLTAGQARPLLAIAERRRQLELAGRAVEEGLTARQLEKLARSARGERGPRPKAAAAPVAPEVFAAAAAEKLTRRLQTRVEVRRAGRGGTIRIHFHSEEELIRLYDRIMERP